MKVGNYLFYKAVLAFLLSGSHFTEASDAEKMSYLAIEKQYYSHFFTVSEMNQNLPMLRNLASKSSSVGIVGLHDFGVLWSSLMGLSDSNAASKSFVGIDAYFSKLKSLENVLHFGKEQKIDCQFIDFKNDFSHLPSVDLLLINLEESPIKQFDFYEKLMGLFSKARQFIVICNARARIIDWNEHRIGDSLRKKKLWDVAARLSSENCRFLPAPFNEDQLTAAVNCFLRSHPDWSFFSGEGIAQNLDILCCNKDGLRGPFPRKCLAEQVEDVENECFALDLVRKAKIDEFIKNKIVLCTGPSFARRSQLKEITDRDATIIPFKKVFIASNDPRNLDLTYENCSPVYLTVNDPGHQLGCLNCIITGLKEAAFDPELEGDDIIIFKHESVYINDMYLVRRAVEKLMQGYNMVVRHFKDAHFHSTDVFFIKVLAARELVKDLEIVTALTPELPYCEYFFTRYFVEKLDKVYVIDSNHLARKDIQLGFFHVPPLIADMENTFWDRKNYHDLYNN